MSITRAIAVSLWLAGTCAAASAGQSPGGTFLKVDIGWNGFYRVGHWTPIFITASDPNPRNAVIEAYVPHDGMNGMRIRQTATIGPRPATYAIYAPLWLLADDLSVALREPGTERRLATVARRDLAYHSSKPQMRTVTQLTVVSGAGAPNRAVENQLSDEMQAACTWVEPVRLPFSATGYDGINLLILDRPDLASMPLEQQEAIVNWVRAGGQLLCWIGDRSLAASSPILDALPALVGDTTAVELTQVATRSAGFAEKVNHALLGRQLTPRPEARSISFLNGEVPVYRQRVGLGVTTLVSIDPSQFSFADASSAQNFWRPLVGDALRSGETVRQTEAAAVEAVALLGNNARVADHSLGVLRILIVMVGLVVAVALIDWMTIKRLEGRVWLWVVLGLWVLAIAAGAEQLQNGIKSRDAQVHTIELIDQAGGSSVAKMNVIGIESAQTEDYQMSKTDPNGWWQPLAADLYPSASGAALADIDFHQDQRGSRPERIRFPGSRFIVAETMEPGPAVIDASLRVEQNRLVGKITNLGGQTLKNIFVRYKGGACELKDVLIPPNGSVNVDAPVIDHPSSAVELFDLAADRSARVNQWLKSENDVACVYAQVDQAKSEIQLSPPPDRQQHVAFVRALFNMQAK